MKWKKEELEILKQDYLNKRYIGDIALKLNRSIRSVQHKTERLELFRNPIKIKHERNRKVADSRYYSQNKKEIYKRKRDRIRKMKEELVSLMGGKCSNCGYNQCVAALEFHHCNEDKESSIAILIKDYSKQKALKEAHKCILLCANCHREAHHKGS